MTPCFSIDDDLWAEVEPLIQQRPRRPRHPCRKPLPDRAVLNGILHVLRSGIAWDALPQELGYGSGVTCWRRLRDWERAGAWAGLRERLEAGHALPGSRAVQRQRVLA